MGAYYILDEDNNAVVASGGVAEWAMWFEDNYTTRRVVARDHISDKLMVSTVFLGIDHAFGSGTEPVLFETMVFRNGDGREMDRYRTWAEAEAGHIAMLKRVMEEEDN